MMPTDTGTSYCAGTSYAGSNKAVAGINSVLADLVATGSTGGGFATSTAGKGKYVVYGLAQCRGDVSAADCAACLTADAKQLPISCSSSSDARIWYDYCFMLYDNSNFIGQSDTDAGVVYVNVQVADNAKAFAKLVEYTPFVSVYGLAQCTRDLAPLTCAQCLSTAVSRFGEYCGAQVGCQINYSSCRVRHEIYPFYFPVDGDPGGRAATDLTKYTKIVVRVHP
ncbi:Cysteine-rich repeat secretory protein 55 [Dichanthelium oligosanthes]|uniref:Cysteine-rich repeat secretory protein 55 n=1 Tax=Dichanthelium oligosanthes TaxID=888268 RepID=A0A1E5VFY3_9POAL|nr:Cysteine-rich repeat secretory protein 55 [Dichanthelium oligosanthes]